MPKAESAPEIKAPTIRIFQLNDESAEFEEIQFSPSVKLLELLKPNLILYFVEPEKFRSFIWTGSEASIRMKFIAAGSAAKVRDNISPAIKISTLDEGEESLAFKIMVGLEKEITYEEAKTGPVYVGKAADQILLEDLTLEKLVLLLDKIGCPEGFTREMVIEGRNIYGYHETYREYMGDVIKERKLYPLQEQVKDGTYFPNHLIPRIVMSYNKVLITELLRRLTPEEIAKEAEREEKIATLRKSTTPFAH